MINQAILFQSVTVSSAPLLTKVFEDTFSGPLWSKNITNITKQSEGSAVLKPVTHSCCFLPAKENNKALVRLEKRKPKRKAFPSSKAFSTFMRSLDALKKNTFKKLHQIDSINQEIKGLKSLCKDTEDKKWIQGLEKVMYKQKEFTVKTSQACLGELKKIATECNLEPFIDNKLLNIGDCNKTTLLNDSNSYAPLFAPKTEMKEKIAKKVSKFSTPTKNLKFSEKIQKIVRNFFEDIQDGDISLKKKTKVNKNEKIANIKTEEGGDAVSIHDLGRGLITQKIFNLGNFGDRFFTEVPPENPKIKQNYQKEESNSQLILLPNETSKQNSQDDVKNNFDVAVEETVSKSNVTPFNIIYSDSIPLHKADVPVVHSDERIKQTSTSNTQTKSTSNSLSDDVGPLLLETSSYSTSEFSCEKFVKAYLQKRKKSLFCKRSSKNFFKSPKYKRQKYFMPYNILRSFQNFNANESSDSTDTQRLIIAKLLKESSDKDISEELSSTLAKSSKKLRQKNKQNRCNIRNINVEGYYIKNKKHKSHKKDSKKRKEKKKESSLDLTSTSRGGLSSIKKNSKWKNLAKAKFKIKIEKPSESTLDVDSNLENSQISSEIEKRFKANNISDGQVEHNKVTMFLTDNQIFNCPKKFVSKSISSISMNSKKTEDKKPISEAEILAIKSSHNFEMAKKGQENSNESKTEEYCPNTTKEMNSKENLLGSFKENETNIKDTKWSLPLQSQIKLNKMHSITCSKSLTNFNTQLRKNFTENINDRRKSAREISDQKKKLNLSISNNNKSTTVTNLLSHCQLSTDSQMKPGEICKTQVAFTPKEIPYCVCQSSDVPTVQPYNNENIVLESPTIARCEIEKYHFLDKELQDSKFVKESVTIFQVLPSNPDPVLKNESKESFSTKGPDMKGDSAFQNTENKADILEPLSFKSIKKTTVSRPHSVESLIPLKQTPKKKRKKRPYCSRRNSRQYLRKNSGVLRKPRKVDSKQMNFLNLTEKEQLKIISQKVAKYLREKLERELEIVTNNDNQIMKTNIDQLTDTENLQKVEATTNINKQKCENPLEPVQGPTEVEKELVNTDRPEEVKAEENEKPKPNKKDLKKQRLNFVKLNKEAAGKIKKPSTITEANKQSDLTEKDKKKSKIPMRKKEVKKLPPKPLTPTTIEVKTSKDSTDNKTESTSKIRTPEAVKRPKTPKKNKEKLQNSQTSTEKNSETHKKKDDQKLPLVKEESLIEVENCEVDFSPNQDPGLRTSILPPYVIIPTSASSVICPELICQTKKLYTKIEKKSNSFTEKQLMELQLCPKDDISTNLDSDTIEFKLLMNTNNTDKSSLENSSTAPMELYSTSSKGVFLIEMNGVNSGSSTEFGENREGRIYDFPVSSKEENETINLSNQNIPIESGDSKTINLGLLNALDNENEGNSDSSFNCEISIALNKSLKPLEDDINGIEIFPEDFCKELEVKNDLKRKKNVKTKEDSRLLATKLLRKKRKDNEISMEMKKKLLEILEGEIQKEMTMIYATSSENSNDSWTLKWDDSCDVNHTVSNETENHEVLAQISETMRQYLSKYKKSLLKNSKSIKKDENEDAS